MRIISGKLKGRKLNRFPGSQIRPTADRLRESIFNILNAKTHNAIVLDLFAGTGAMGIEALSRGALSAVFLDNHSHATGLIQTNLNLCNLEHQSTVIKWDVLKNLNCLSAFEASFSLVFVDPPYAKNMVEPTMRHLLNCGALEKGTWIVAEHADTELLLEPISGIQLLQQRKYGKTLVSFFEVMI